MSHRLAFVGSCQVTGMRAAARVLRPDIEVEGHHVGAFHNAREIAELVDGFDTVVTQISEGDTQAPELTPSALQSRVGKVVFMPIFVFSGLHPDMIYIAHEGKAMPGVYSEMHSLLTVSSYLLELSEKRAKSLFNAYVFAQLGYFAAYEASYPAMVAQFSAAGYDMNGLPERWMQNSGSFMYTVNHPAISVLSEMAVESLKRADLVSQDTSAPTDVDDYLFSAFVAPIYPPLAKRIGLAANETFLKSESYGGEREFSLDEYIQRSYAIYRDMPDDVLRTDHIRFTCERLASFLY